MTAPDVEQWRDPEKTLCFCHNVSAGRVRDLVIACEAKTPEDVARRCKAGTGCKSCLPDIETIIEQERAKRPGWFGRWIAAWRRRP